MTDHPTNSENVLRFLRQHQNEHGFAPSLREIAAACQVSVPGVSLCLMWLEGQGRIRRRPGVARSIVIVDDGTD